MTTPTYTPRAGSLASQVIGFFRHNPDEELLLDDITDKFDCTKGNIHTLLAEAVKAALLARDRNEDGDYVYTAGAACRTYATPDGAIAATVAKTKAADDQLAPPAQRPGAQDALAHPSRIGNRLHYRDGRVTDLQGEPIKTQGATP